MFFPWMKSSWCLGCKGYLWPWRPERIRKILFAWFLIEFVKMLNCCAIWTFFFFFSLRVSKTVCACSLIRYHCCIGTLSWSLGWFWHHFIALHVYEGNETLNIFCCTKVNLATYSLSDRLWQTTWGAMHLCLLNVLKTHHTM